MVLRGLLRSGGFGGGLGGLGGSDLGLFGLHFDLLLHLASVAQEFAGGRKFTEAVSNHILGDQNVQMYPAVIYPKSKSHHFRRDLRTTRPSFDDTRLRRLFAGDLFEEGLLDEWAFVK